MVRPTLHLHPHREPAPLRPAATVLLLRDAPGGLEVLMTRRSDAASFAPGAFVFPGGGIDEADQAAHALAARRPTQHDLLLTQSIAAIRESFEELGILLARDREGRLADQRHIAGLDRGGDFFAQCREQGLSLAADEVFLLAHWITDRAHPKRFDVPFLVARMPGGQEPVADEQEQFEPVWIRPDEAVERHRAREWQMLFPTVRTLDHLRRYASVDAALHACTSETPLWVSCPRAGLRGGKEARFMESDEPYGELALVCPQGQIVHPLDWQNERPVPLLRHLQRLTAPNAGIMTGPGTNTYLVGEAATGFIVIDPGPDDAAHIGRIVQATGGDVRAIICTHSHADHSPAARPLQALCPDRPPVLGLASHPTADARSAFSPDRELADGEVVRLTGDGLSHSLQVVHTPGHAANHLCLVLVEDALLFSGDHILNGSTTVINPPDGHMDDYLQSLDRLLALCEDGGIEFILPAHGYVLGHAAASITALKAHRLRREAKIIGVMRSNPQGTLQDWLPLAYDDVPPAIWPVAQRSLLAHVERIQALGLA